VVQSPRTSLPSDVEEVPLKPKGVNQKPNPKKLKEESSSLEARRGQGVHSHRIMINTPLSDNRKK